MLQEVKILVKNATTKDGRKFKSYKLVDSDNNGKLIDCVMCKSIEASKLDELSKTNKAVVEGDISINYNYEFPKAFVRSIDRVTKIN